MCEKDNVSHIIKTDPLKSVHIGIKKVGNFFACLLLLFLYVLLCRQKYQKRPLNFGYGLRHRLRYPQRRKPWWLVSTTQSTSSALHLSCCHKGTVYRPPTRLCRYILAINKLSVSLKQLKLAPIHGGRSHPRQEGESAEGNFAVVRFSAVLQILTNANNNVKVQSVVKI